MENLFINHLHEKSVDKFTSGLGLYLRRTADKPFKKMCNIFTNAHITRQNRGVGLSDEEYFSNLDDSYEPLDRSIIDSKKNNIVVERYPKLVDDEPYIFVCNHTCPEDIETVLNIIDRNAYLILGSIESLKHNPEMYLSWLNGMVPFDILDPEQRKIVFEKMVRVLQSNSILIFPEGSHNYSPNNLVNKLFDGPVNLALETGRKIVVVTLIKDFENNVSYIDVGNPIDVRELEVDMNREFDSELEKSKFYVNSLTSMIRDRMATAVYYIISRHFETLRNSDYENVEEYLRIQKIRYAFEKMKWDKDIFDAEYLTKKTQADREHEEIVRCLADLTMNEEAYLGGNRYWVLNHLNCMNKDVVLRMRKYLEEQQQSLGGDKRMRKVK